MLRHLTEWFKDIAGMWMVIGILTVTLLVFSAAKHFGFTANSKISSVNQELNDLSFEKYNGINLTGSEVINAIKRYQEELPVTVYTGESVDTYQGKFRPSNNSRKSEKYIKPSQTYTGSLLKDADKEIVGLVFAKEGILLTDTSYKELLAKMVGADSKESTMDSLIQQINNMLSNRNETITTLTQKVTSLNTTLSNLQSKNNTLSTQVSNLDAQLRTANSKYGSLLIEVSSAKSAIASAITNKGVSTSASDSFSNMANNVSNISTKGLLCEEYTYSNRSIPCGGTSSMSLTVTAQNLVPEFVVIQSKMYLSTGYGDANIGVITMTSTKYSTGKYTASSGSVDNNSSIQFSGSQVIINPYIYIIYTGGYYPYSDGTTKVSVYGLKR